ncbi:hypothetical protein [Pseudoalteromonas prydzensis]|uniref:hypothetical protein n=1 Tax=Pseudoalteromonas prydzensis TaxID=182141 RepID=UPI0024BC7F00|nr:hypothetical protein [Pseudoalteromonas prydzensis]
MTEQEKLQRKESEFIKVMIIIALSVLLGVGGTFGYFFEFSPSRDIKTWVYTATIFTGVATPILTTVSVFLLYFVWKDNRRELAETKKALTEQSDTQNFSVIKEAVFNIADDIKSSLNKKVLFANGENGCFLEMENTSRFEKLNSENDNDFYEKEIKTIEDYLKDHYQLFAPLDNASKLEPVNSVNLRKLIYGKPTEPCIDRVRMLGLFLKKVKSEEYKNILELTLFSKLTAYSWLLLIDIAHRLYVIAEEDKDAALLVFLEVSGLVCRQSLQVGYIKALPEGVIADLKKYNLI